MGAQLRDNAAEGFLGPRGLINHDEYVRLLQQALHQLGYPALAQRLEEESVRPQPSALSAPGPRSGLPPPCRRTAAHVPVVVFSGAQGITMQPRPATLFRDAVLGGDFAAALHLLPQLGPSPASVERAAFLLLRQKYVEAVQRGDAGGALRCLRSELAPLQGAAPGGGGGGTVLQSLAALLLQAAPAPAPAPARETLLGELQALLPPSVLVPEARLEELVEQALVAQLERCPYHNSRALRLSLFIDYTAGPEQLPTRASQVLAGHADEVWAVQFSADGRWMVTASKDGSALLW